MGAGRRTGAEARATEASIAPLVPIVALYLLFKYASVFAVMIAGWVTLRAFLPAAVPQYSAPGDELATVLTNNLVVIAAAPVVILGWPRLTRWVVLKRRRQSPALRRRLTTQARPYRLFESMIGGTLLAIVIGLKIEAATDGLTAARVSTLLRFGFVLSSAGSIGVAIGVYYRRGLEPCCARCGYPASPGSPRCPECGRAFSRFWSVRAGAARTKWSWVVAGAAAWLAGSGLFFGANRIAGLP